jgi:hypothetical protein
MAIGVLLASSLSPSAVSPREDGIQEAGIPFLVSHWLVEEEID